MKVLIFGGTAEARDLANQLAHGGHDVVTSLAGRTNAPLLPEGNIRVGGFGGVLRLQTYFTDERFDFVVDATHPFAESISRQVPEAAQSAGVPFLCLRRAPWDKPDGADWHEFLSTSEAIAGLPKGSTGFITSGHKGLEAINQRPDCRFVVRLIEEPATALPSNTELILARPPYGLEAEIRLMEVHGISHLIAKNSGGDQTRAKIDAAATLGIAIYIVAPSAPVTDAVVETVEAALGRLHQGAVL